MQTAIKHITDTDIWVALESVKDPEIPVISVVEMGIVTKVASGESQVASGQSSRYARVTMTPTFVGCPAIGVMKKDIYDAVKKLGFEEVEVTVDMDTAWSSDRMTPEAKSKLEKFGIAPPAVMDSDLTEEMLDKVRCPHCHSTDTTLRSAFGSTLCRAIRFCFSCKQGFEQFKPL
ncbi:MAG: phenylacetate-CoA oxygenase, paaj subunit [Bacteroidetes bacterium]|nr:phenylacetate-CoA oxygenase, paaj subunit [Bacteroidota bacterium]